MSNSQVIAGLKEIHSFKGIHVEDPIVKRRSSVALILRFPGLDIPSGASLDKFLDLALEHALEPAEILFIKRTSRKGDRWSGHVALPGGKRDPEDESDVKTAVRETMEEVGLDLTNGLCVGPLDQRLVKTSWGRVTLMTLCPFIFIVSSGKKSSPNLVLQPTEVDRAFWIPVPQLYTVDAGTAGFETVPLGDRLRLHNNPLIPRFLHPFIQSWIVGNMLFGATDLCDPRDMVISSQDRSIDESTVDLIPDNSPPPYKLWGLTLGVVTDFLEIIRPKSEILAFYYPTMQAPDLRLTLALLTYRFRRLKAQHFRALDTHIEGSMDLSGYALNGYFNYLADAIFIGLALRAATIGYISYKAIKFVVNRA